MAATVIQAALKYNINADPITDPIVNVLHAVSLTGATTPVNIATEVLVAWGTFMMPAISNDFYLTECNWRELLPTPGPGSTIVSGAPARGGRASGAAMANSTQIVTWNTGFIGRAHRGRSFLPMPGPGDINSQDTFKPAQAALVTTCGVNLLTALNGLTDPLQLAIFHRATHTFDVVTDAVGRTYVGTQRKRVNRR
jgi:hypothetical protein